MDDKQTEKAPKVASKSFMTVGPTLHYSHKNVQRCWLLAVAAFVLSCLFWSKIVTGSFWSFSFQVLTSPNFWRLGQTVTTGVSIFEYPWQILVLGLLMGILGIVPVLTSQLMSFQHCLPFILAVVFIANLPGLALCVLVSCFAAACRPLRFRSRFIAIVLCTAPQLIYWGCFGGARGADPVEWGFSFTPWICAWLVGLGIAGLVLGIGHYTRYRPGLVLAFTLVFLLLAVVTFEIRIHFDELDYQLYVAKNNPEQTEEFHDHSITEALDETIANPAVRKYLAGSFYPTEPIELRAKLKEKIQTQLRFDRWPSWFIIPPELKYQDRKRWLFEQYNSFINRRPQSRRMPIALYYKALLSEYSPDIKTLERKERLHFYSDYPYERSRQIWWSLYVDFGTSPESAEARWRIAKYWAGRGSFEQADELLAEAQTMVAKRLELREKEQTQSETFFRSFRPPADSAMTISKLSELQRRLSQLRNLISLQNRTDKPKSGARLARFVMLNPHAFDYERRLDELLGEISDKDPLRDNILLAKTKLLADEQLRAERLSKLHEQFKGNDGGIEALYELALLKRRLWSQQDKSNLEQKKKCLVETRTILTKFIDSYPDSIFAEQVKKILNNLPTN
ncbi:MAG: ABC transporter permease [Planctomycetota bacterium]